MTWRQAAAVGILLSGVCGLFALDAAGLGRADRIGPGTLIRIVDSAGVYRVGGWSSDAGSWQAIGLQDGAAVLVLPGEVGGVVPPGAVGSALTGVTTAGTNENPADPTSDNARYV